MWDETLRMWSLGPLREQAQVMDVVPEGGDRRETRKPTATVTGEVRPPDPPPSQARRTKIP